MSTAAVGRVLTIGDGALHRDCDAFGNPFRAEYLVALVVLIAVFARWRAVRPVPRPLWRWQAIGACGVAMMIVLGQLIRGSHAVVVGWLFGWLGVAVASQSSSGWRRAPSCRSHGAR